MSRDILIFSDSHGNVGELIYAIQDHPGVERIVFLGDGTRDAREAEKATGRTILKVRGNNDYDDRENPASRVMEFAGHRFFLCHGNQYGVGSSMKALVRAARKEDCDIALFGHTHSYTTGRLDGVFYLNPGAIRFPRANSHSYVILHMMGGDEWEVEKISLE